MGQQPPTFGMIHGRFQPFHNGHLEYLHLARPRCRTLIVGITNPDPWAIAEEETSAHRHRSDSNPYTYFERQCMIRETLRDERIGLEEVIFIPFAVNLPERWPFYVPPDTVHYLRVFSPWEQAKAGRLAEHGYEVEILQPGIAKEIEATEVRRRLRSSLEWESLVPPGTARVMRSLGAR
jgi:cytidyltransferase-like protein